MKWVPIKRVSLDQQIEEVRMAIDDYPHLARGGAWSKSKIEYRVARLGWALKTLRWVEENEADIRIFIAQRNSRRIVDEITYAP